MNQAKAAIYTFEKVLTDKTIWEFAASKNKTIEEFDGKPLKTKFYGQFSPGLDITGKSGLRWTGGSAIHVNVGQVVLARTIDKPRTIYIIKIEKQEADKETVTVKYAIIQD